MKSLRFSTNSLDDSVALMISSLSSSTPDLGSKASLVRSGMILVRNPRMTSVFKFLSWTSSRTITLYFRKRASSWSSRIRIPSVMNFTAVPEPSLRSCRTWYPTTSPNRDPSS